MAMMSSLPNARANSRYWISWDCAIFIVVDVILAIDEVTQRVDHIFANASD